MSKLGKILISVGSCLVVAVVAISIYIFWPAITGTINGSKYYTSQDVQNAYDQGYTDGNKSEESLTAKYEYYKSLVDEYYVEVESLNRELLVLTESNNSFSSQVVELETQKDLLEEQVNNLTTIKSNNELTIEDLESQVITLQNEVVRLQNDLTSNAQLIAQKNNQILSLQSTISQLQTTNELNLQTINNLNNQITTLNNQISDMTLQIQNNSSNVSALNSKIAELEKSVAYYEQYIANLEQGEQVVVTFEFNGSVYNIQIVNKNDVVSVVNPTSTDYVIFNYWTVNGEQVDLSTYQVTANTKIVADVTYKYDVKFIVDESIYNNQIVVKNGFATIPNVPSKTNYEFDGWTINGVDLVDVSSYKITENTTFVAKFTKYHTVTFMYEDEVVSTQYVKNNAYVTDVNIDSTDYEVFNGWTLNSVIVDLTSQKIVADTTFIASITYKHDVKFMIDDEVYNHQIVEVNTYAIVPENPTKDGYIFNGWTINGVDIIDISSYIVLNNVDFYAIFIDSVGLFDYNTGLMTMSWNDLLVNDYLIENDGILSAGSNSKSIDGALYLPNSITSISNSTFSQAKSLKKISIPSSVTTIGQYAFYQCGLEEIDLSLNEELDFSSKYVFDRLSISKVNIDNIDLFFKALSKYTTNSQTIFGAKGADLYLNNVLVTELVIPSFITSIPINSFKYCNSIESLILHNNLDSIGRTAFAYCKRLSNIDWGNSITSIGSESFFYCSSITELVLPSSLLSIENGAFNYTSIESLIIPDNVTFVNYGFNNIETLKYFYLGSGCSNFVVNSSGTFKNCPNLESIVVDADNPYYTSGNNCNVLIEISTNKLLRGCKNSVIPNNVTALGDYSFEGVSFTSFNIPSSVTTIGQYVFYNSLIENIVVPNTVTTLSKCAFYGCKELVSVTIPSNITVLEQSLFNGCSKLSNINLHNNLTEIKDSVFSNCSSLTAFNFPSSVTTIGSKVFYKSGLVEITYPSTLLSIGSNTLEGCVNLTKATMNCSVIPTTTFYGCKYLVDVVIGNTCTEIQNSAFYQCSALETLIIPSSVKTLGYTLFKYCTNLKGVYISSSVTTISASSSYKNSMVYLASTDVVIYVQSSTIPSGWGKYFSYIDSSSQVEVKLGQSLSAFKSAMGI